MCDDEKYQNISLNNTNNEGSVSNDDLKLENENFVENLEDNHCLPKNKKNDIYLGKQRERSPNEKIEKKKKKRGRMSLKEKKINDDIQNIQGKGKNDCLHDKYKADNMMKKALIIFLNNLIKNANKILEIYKSKQNKNRHFNLFKLDSVYANINRERVLNLLEMKIKDLLSLKISSKYNRTEDTNKNTIKRILKEEKNNKVIDYIFNYMMFEDFINYFTKKEIIEINGNKVQFEGMDEIMKKINNKYKDEEEYIKKIVDIFNNFKDRVKEKRIRIDKKDL